MKKKVYFANDPYETLFQAFTELYPDKEAEICFAPGEEIEEDGGKGALGVTFFPEDGTIPVVRIKIEQTITQVLDIIAHELAHVAAGTAAGHKAEWIKAYQAIYEKYSEIVTTKAEEEGKAVFVDSI